MRKILGFLVVAVLLITATIVPNIIGKKIESEYKKTILETPSEIKLDLISYERDWFSSKAVINLNIFLDNRYEKIGTVTQEISHGIFLGSAPFFAVATSKDKLDLIDEFNDLFDGEAVSGTSVINLDGSLSAKYTIAQSSKNISDVVWSRSPVKISFSPKSKKFDFSFDVATFAFEDQGVSNLAIRSSGTLDSLNLGDTTIKIGKVLLHEGRIDGVFVGTKTKLENNKVAVDTSFLVDSIATQKKTIKNLKWDFVLKDLDPKLLKNYLEIVENFDSEYLEDDLIAILIEMGDSGATIGTNIYMEDDGKVADFKANISTNKNAFFTPAFPFSLVNKINIDLDLLIDRAIVYEYDPEFDRNYLELFIKGNFVQIDKNNKIKAKIAIENGKILLNGKELPF